VKLEFEVRCEKITSSYQEFKIKNFYFPSSRYHIFTVLWYHILADVNWIAKIAKLREKREHFK